MSARHGATFETTPLERVLITACVMAATVMQAIDTTIANVALPYMQGSLSATLDQVSWVLTSYIVAAAIMTAPAGWLALRFGRKRMLVICAAGFTLASMLCGIAQTIDEMVLFRLLQGVFGAALVPLSQAVMLDIFPPERRGAAMSIWGMGVMLGPIVGPALGGYLTDGFSWRWVFFVNVPFGIATVAGLILVMRETEPEPERRFDWLGFGMLSLAIGSLQLMLDRGEQVGWFESGEIVTYAVLTGLGAYVYLSHSFTTDRPFIPPAMFLDRNFTVSVIFMFLAGILILATLALVTPYVQGVMGYPIISAGYVLGTRGLGTMLAMMAVGRLLGLMDARLLVGAGLALSTYSLYELVGISPDTSATSLVLVNVVQGVGLGLIFVPLNTIAFATLDARLRTEAASVWTLIRNLGSSIGVSIVIAQLTSGTELMHARLGEALTPFSLGLQLGAGGPLDPASRSGRALLDATLTRQAMLIAYSNDFLLMTIVSLAAFPLLLLLKAGRQR
ncbi:MAG: DHA2 family efflux MFS transporter permease subunit [Hyphomicrobiaceae bacterium]